MLWYIILLAHINDRILTVINRDERIIYCHNVNVGLVGSCAHYKADNIIVQTRI